MTKMMTVVWDPFIRLLHLALVLIGLHLAGVAAMAWMHRENLPAAMVTGRKRPHTD